MSKFYNFLFIGLFIFTSIFAQKTNTLSGIVVDAETNEPLPFANILTLESKKGNTTGKDGNFTLNNIFQDEKIKISYVGYQTLIYKLYPELFLSDVKVVIKLQSVNINLQEVTVYANTIGTTDQVKSSNLTIQSEKIREISVGMPDILRSIQSLPGITANNALKAEFNVRGGNHDENASLP